MARWRALVVLVGAVLVVASMTLPGGTLPAANYAGARLAGDPAAVRAARAATDAYHDVAAARADGYQVLGPCIGNGYGAAGFHYVNRAHVADGVLDPAKPEILLYVPDDDHRDRLRLVALEYFAVDGDQDMDTVEDRAVFGVPMLGPIPGRTADQPVHYELHAWLWSDNPDGTFAHLNPELGC